MPDYIYFNTEPNVNILGLAPIIKGFFVQEMEDLGGAKLSDFIYELQDGTFNAGCKKKEWNKMSEIFLQKFLDDHTFPATLSSLLEERGQKLYDTCFEIFGKIESNSITLDEKKQHLLELFKLFADMCVPGLVAPTIEFANGGMTNKIKEILDTKDLEILGMTTGEALVLLTQSPKITWTDKAREALYHLAQELYEEDVDIHNVEESQKDRVKMYITQWGWVHYGYCGPEYTIQNVLDELEIIFEKKESPVDQIEYAKKELHKKMEKQEALFKKLDMNADERYIITAAQDFGYTKSYRASLMSLANLTINTLLKEYTKKEGYSFGQMGVCTAEEVCSYLRGEKPLPDVDTLNKRMQFSVFFSGLGIDKVIVGSEAKKWVADNVEQEEVDRDMTEIPGTVACSGDEDVVRGVAKIVLRSDDLAKVTQGDVIISTTTIPEYVPAMRRASAIATETGGLTCHAAIVSREMNKPCLIGIKHVTQIFKDGDHVEVDLKNSLIKKI